VAPHYGLVINAPTKHAWYPVAPHYGLVIQCAYEPCKERSCARGPQSCLSLNGNDHLAPLVTTFGQITQSQDTPVDAVSRQTRCEPATATSAVPHPNPRSSALRSDVALSVRNAVKLGSSLMATWAVALVVRIYLPRHLGPGLFGAFQFASAFTTTVFVVTSLGIDTYVRKEVSTRREHATELFGGTLLLRLVLSAVIMTIAVLALSAAGKPERVLRLVIVLGAAQMLLVANSTYGAMLQAVGAVDGLSLLNVLAKVGWGAGIILALTLGGGVEGVAAAMLVSEAGRTCGLVLLTRRHLGLRFVVDLGASMAVIGASLPIYVGHLAQSIYGNLDVSIMSFLTSDVEVGWYSAASTIAGIAFLLSPIILWVLMPLASRAKARSPDEVMLITRRAMEAVLAVAFPATLFLWISADLIVTLGFGRAYAPATQSLRILAPSFVLTYAAMVSANILIRLDRAWAVTAVSGVGIALSAALNLWLVPRGLAAFGPGGAGIGAASALIITECWTTGALVWLMGREAFDGRLIAMLAKTLGVCAVVLALDHVLLPLGAWRLLIDVAVYAALVVSSGALDVRGALAYFLAGVGRRGSAAEVTA
jgi:O-antigen/teichoic acid export membrane protein